ncbi:Inversin [Metarhizium anisopliae]
MVNFLLKNTADIESQDRWGGTPLHAAVRSSKETIVKQAIVKLLLDKAANVEARDGRRRTSLYWAREYGEDGIDTLLIEYGANTNLLPNGNVQ